MAQVTQGEVEEIGQARVPLLVEEDYSREKSHYYTCVEACLGYSNDIWSIGVHLARMS